MADEVNLAAERVPALILAAGVGRRLAGINAGRPKAMLDLHGRPLLERALSALEASGWRQAIVVTGHAAATIEDFLAHRRGAIAVSTVHNPRFAETNNIVSMLAAADHLHRGFCLLNSDIVFGFSILRSVLSRGSGVWLAVDGDEVLGAEEMKVAVDGDGTLARISKQLDPAASVGEYIGIVKFDAPGAATVLESARALVREGGDQLYYEDAIDRAAGRLGAQLVFTAGVPWTEIDDEADYRRAIGVASRLDDETEA
jgi:choline kinase